MIVTIFVQLLVREAVAMKRRVVLISVSLAALGLVSEPGYGQWYGGISLGQSESDQGVQFDRPPETETDDSTDIIWKLFGGYSFSPAFSVEVGYADLGDEFTTFNIFGGNERTELDVRALDASFIGRSQVHEKVDFFGRIGLAYWDVDLKYSEAAFGTSGNDNDIDLLIGLGVEWHFGESVGFRFEWQQFQNVGDEVKTRASLPGGARLELNGQDINTLNFALTYAF